MKSYIDLFSDIDRNGPVPLYFQLARKIEEAIQSGELAPGAKLDNEIKIGEALGLSRPTVRRAIQELVDSGLLVRRRGVGTQVVHGKVTRRFELSSLYEDLEAANKKATTKLLLYELMSPPGEVIDALSVAPNDTVLRIKRLRFADGVPFALLENYLPPELADISAKKLESDSLYRILRMKGTTMSVAKQTLSARNATQEEIGHFKCDEGSAVLTSKRILYDDSGNAVEYGNHSYLPEMYSFEVTLVNR